MKFKKFMDLMKVFKKGSEDLDIDIEFWLGENQMLEVKTMGQFGVVPDVVVTLKKINE